METTEQRVTRLRRVVVQDLAAASVGFDAALRSELPGVFVWHGCQFWVDRVRRLIVPAAGADAWRSCPTLPDDGDLGDARNLLEVYGGSARLEDTGSILNMLAWLICGVERHHGWTPTGAHLLNLSIAQRAINPAFGSLFWLALADDSGPRGHRRNLYDLVGPMIYEQMDYPGHTPNSSDVRRAQIAFLDSLFPGAADPGCKQLSDTQWAEHCDAQLRGHQGFVDDRVFFELLSRVGAAAREPGARPFW